MLFPRVSVSHTPLQKVPPRYQIWPCRATPEVSEPHCEVRDVSTKASAWLYRKRRRHRTKSCSNKCKPTTYRFSRLHTTHRKETADVTTIASRGAIGLATRRLLKSDSREIPGSFHFESTGQAVTSQEIGGWDKRCAPLRPCGYARMTHTAKGKRRC